MQDILVWIVIAAALLYSIRRIARSFSKNKNCDDCSDCGTQDCESRDK